MVVKYFISHENNTSTWSWWKYKSLPFNLCLIGLFALQFLILFLAKASVLFLPIIIFDVLIIILLNGLFVLTFLLFSAFGKVKGSVDVEIAIKLKSILVLVGIIVCLSSVIYTVVKTVH